MEQRQYKDSSTPEIKERLVAINRVAKTTKGGRNFRFTALMVVGDENGHVGVGSGKAAEIPEAIRKGVEAAKKNMVEIARHGTTIPHETQGHFGKGSVLLMPAEEGSGVIAGGAVRAVLELAGIPYQELGLQQSRQHGKGHPRRPQAAADRRTDRSCAR